MRFTKNWTECKSRAICITSVNSSLIMFRARRRPRSRRTLTSSSSLQLKWIYSRPATFSFSCMDFTLCFCTSWATWSCGTTRTPGWELSPRWLVWSQLRARQVGPSTTTATRRCSPGLIITAACRAYFSGSSRAEAPNGGDTCIINITANRM